MKISATIVAKNEESNIARAIASLRCCDEIVVIDSGSTDKTVELAAQLGARVIFNDWPGYAQQKNFAAEQSANDWIFSLDADEALSEPLQNEIAELKEGSLPDSVVCAFDMPRLARYCGRWIRHGGWYPDRKVRLYDRSKSRWEGNLIHESVSVRGPIQHLNSDLLHFTCNSLTEHLNTMNRYTTLAAKGVRGRTTLLRLMVDPAWTFFRTYIIRRGFLDGAEGLSIAWMAALYTYLKYAKARS